MVFGLFLMYTIGTGKNPAANTSEVNLFNSILHGLDNGAQGHSHTIPMKKA